MRWKRERLGVGSTLGALCEGPVFSELARAWYPASAIIGPATIEKSSMGGPETSDTPGGRSGPLGWLVTIAIFRPRCRVSPRLVGQMRDEATRAMVLSWPAVF